MNYYQHHIGDFNAGTFRMSRLERWIYRDMIEVYYDKEAPFPLDLAAVCKMVGAKEAGEREIVADLLSDKFTQTDAGYVHERCEAEIEAYRAKAGAARQNGRLGGRPRKPIQNQTETEQKPTETQSVILANPEETERNPDQTGSKANQEPRTKNQEPKEKRTRSASARAPKFDALAWLLARGVDEKRAGEWLGVRKDKRLSNTETAFEEIGEEIVKSGLEANEVIRICIVRSWGSFRAHWDRGDAGGQQPVFPSATPQRGHVNKQEALEASNREVARRFLEEMDGDGNE